MTKVPYAKAIVPLNLDPLSNHDPYFLMRSDKASRRGLSPLQSCTVAICISHMDHLSIVSMSMLEFLNAV